MFQLPYCSSAGPDISFRVTSNDRVEERKMDRQWLYRRSTPGGGRTRKSEKFFRSHGIPVSTSQLQFTIDMPEISVNSVRLNKTLFESCQWGIVSK